MNYSLKFICFAGMVALLLAIPAGAQIDNQVTFNAPFAFYAGNAKLPAGAYNITQPDDTDHTVLIESPDGSHSVLLEFEPVDANSPSPITEVTFKKYGESEFLSGVSVEGEDSSLQILQTKAEKNAAKSAEANSHALTAKSGT